MSINKISLDDVEEFRRISQRINALDQYSAIATKSAIYPGAGTPLGLAYVALKMNGEAGEFAEHVGKAMRDDDLLTEFLDEEESSTFPNEVVRAAGVRKVYSYPSYDMTDTRRDLLIKEIGDVLWYLSAACNELGISLSYAALVNLEKLYDRTQRNALQGSGDNR